MFGCWCFKIETITFIYNGFRSGWTKSSYLNLALLQTRHILFQGRYA